MASTRLEKPSVVRDEPLLWKATLIALLHDRPASTTLLQFSVQHLVSDMHVFCVAMQIALLSCSMVTTLVADEQTRYLRSCLPNPLIFGLLDCLPESIRAISVSQLALKRSRLLSMRQSILSITECGKHLSGYPKMLRMRLRSMPWRAF
jgi:hypothetical protein